MIVCDNRGVRSLLPIVGLLLGCTVGPLSPEGRPCAADNTCGPGARCDPKTQTCTTSAMGDTYGSHDFGFPDHQTVPDVPGPGDSVQPPDARLADIIEPPPPMDLPWPVDAAPWPDTTPWPNDLSPPSCAQLFGAAPNFKLCTETPTSCTFYNVINLFLGGSCNKVCAQYSATCLEAFKDASNGCAWTDIVSCGYSHSQDAVCTCSR